MQIYIYIVCLFLVAAFDLKANIPTNMQKIDSLYLEIANELISNLTNCSGIYIDSKDGLSSDRLEQAIFKVASKNEIKLYSEKMPNTCAIKLNVDLVRVQYTQTEDSQIIERLVEINSTIQIINSKAEINLIECNRKVTDSLNIPELQAIEEGSPEYAKGKIPEKDTFFDKVLKPVVIIGGAVVAVVLLFTVRS